MPAGLQALGLKAAVWLMQELKLVMKQVIQVQGVSETYFTMSQAQAHALCILQTSLSSYT